MFLNANGKAFSYWTIIIFEVQISYIWGPNWMLGTNLKILGWNWNFSIMAKIKEYI